MANDLDRPESNTKSKRYKEQQSAIIQGLKGNTFVHKSLSFSRSPKLSHIQSTKSRLSRKATEILTLKEEPKSVKSTDSFLSF